MDRAALVIPARPALRPALIAAVLGLALVAAMLAGPLTASASAQVADGSVLLAVDGGDLGPDPMPRDAEDNPARDLGGYDDRETQFTWGAAWLLTFLGLGGLATMGLVYWRAVDRPGRGRTPTRR